MNSDERHAIAKYKKAASCLGDGHLIDYVMPDFRDTQLGNIGDYDALVKYVTAAQVYVKYLNAAAQARQYHYDRFIKRLRCEELGHRHWRKGLNEVAADASDKLARWKSVSLAQFDKLVVSSPQRLVLLPEYEEAEDLDVEREASAEGAVIPALSQTEKRRRKKLRRRARDRKEQAERQILQRLVSLYSPEGKADTGAAFITGLPEIVSAVVADPFALQKRKLLNLLLVLKQQVTVVADDGELETALRLLLQASVYSPSANLLAFILRKDPRVVAMWEFLPVRTNAGTTEGGPVLCGSASASHTDLSQAIAMQNICAVVYGMTCYYQLFDVPRDWRAAMLLRKELQKLQTVQEHALQAEKDNRKMLRQAKISMLRTFELYPTLYAAMIHYSRGADVSECQMPETYAIGENIDKTRMIIINNLICSVLGTEKAQEVYRDTVGTLGPVEATKAAFETLANDPARMPSRVPTAVVYGMTSPTEYKE